MSNQEKMEDADEKSAHDPEYDQVWRTFSFI